MNHNFRPGPRKQLLVLTKSINQVCIRAFLLRPHHSISGEKRVQCGAFASEVNVDDSTNIAAIVDENNLLALVANQHRSLKRSIVTNTRGTRRPSYSIVPSSRLPATSADDYGLSGDSAHARRLMNNPASAPRFRRGRMVP